MKNEAEIIWWKTVKQDVETTPLGFTEAASTRRGSRRDGRRGESIFKRGCSLSAIIYILCGFLKRLTRTDRTILTCYLTYLTCIDRDICDLKNTPLASLY